MCYHQHSHILKSVSYWDGEGTYMHMIYFGHVHFHPCAPNSSPGLLQKLLPFMPFHFENNPLSLIGSSCLFQSIGFHWSIGNPPLAISLRKQKQNWGFFLPFSSQPPTANSSSAGGGALWAPPSSLLGLLILWIRHVKTLFLRYTDGTMSFNTLLAVNCDLKADFPTVVLSLSFFSHHHGTRLRKESDSYLISIVQRLKFDFNWCHNYIDSPFPLPYN